MYQILLYYKYIQLKDPAQITLWQKDLCTRLGLTGRIIIAREGINGTVEGTIENINKYIEETCTCAEFADINFKKSEGTGNSFPKLSVKHRKEIVTLGRPDLFPVPSQTGADYLSADELHNWYENKKDDFVILDMRNDYELKVGKFDGSLELPVGNFREIPSYSSELQKLKQKTVVAVCTGGVRCEKGTAYLKQELGFEKVYQLHDGIVDYMNKYPEGHFKGALYVFDGRMTVKNSSTIIGSCDLCNATSEKYINCSKKGCHKHFIVCNGCLEKAGGVEKVLCNNASHSSI